jgi:hypothetical protein
MALLTEVVNVDGIPTLKVSERRCVWQEATHVDPTCEGPYLYTLIDCKAFGCEDPTHRGGDIFASTEYHDELCSKSVSGTKA